MIFTLFVLCLIGHSYAGWKVYDDERQQHVLAIAVLSIGLRQWGSPESKPVHAFAHRDRQQLTRTTERSDGSPRRMLNRSVVGQG